jgi:hypothetical protein
MRVANVSGECGGGGEEHGSGNGGAQNHGVISNDEKWERQCPQKYISRIADLSLSRDELLLITECELQV